MEPLRTPLPDPAGRRLHDPRLDLWRKRLMAYVRGEDAAGAPRREPRQAPAGRTATAR